jgi:hypothetical protein
VVSQRCFFQTLPDADNQSGGYSLAKISRQDVLSKQGAQLAGLLLWRFGLALAAATGLYRTTKFLLQFIDLPLQLELGIGLIFCGAVLFMVSMVLERVVDMRREGDLRQ